VFDASKTRLQFTSIHVLVAYRASYLVHRGRTTRPNRQVDTPRRRGPSDGMSHVGGKRSDSMDCAALPPNRPLRLLEHRVNQIERMLPLFFFLCCKAPATRFLGQERRSISYRAQFVTRAHKLSGQLQTRRRVSAELGVSCAAPSARCTAGTASPCRPTTTPSLTGWRNAPSQSTSRPCHGRSQTEKAMQPTATHASPTRSF